MKEKLLNVLFTIVILCSIYFLSSYSNNKKLNHYDTFIFHGNKFMKNEIIYDLIKYNVDSSDLYSSNDVSLFVSKIKHLEKYHIVNI